MTQEEQNPIAHKLLENNVLMYDGGSLSCCLSCPCESCDHQVDCNNIGHAYLDKGGLEYLKKNYPEYLV